MTDQIVTWVDRHLTDIIKIVVIGFGVIYGYITLQKDVEALYELRRNDKESIERALVDIKTELRDLRLTLVDVLKQKRSEQ